MRAQQLLVLLLSNTLAPAECRAHEVEVRAPGNPHVLPRGTADECTIAGSCECPAQQLVINSATMLPWLAVQPDTFLRVETKKTMGMEIDIYHFKQPGRLSELELPFKLLPLRAIDLTDVGVIEVPADRALDSWYPGYAWSVLVCSRCKGTHIGWKYTPTDGKGQAFYALIVETVDKEQEEPLLTASQHEQLFVSIRVAGRPLAALGLAASAVSAATSV
uniref:CULT domain-containing protein n=1 Tax=Pyrodinium bahamense TaxID=73915 RepID=A0A7S0B850_9DINO|mmetsp:Transcript_5397/g.15034  ORF Transcript_5397/g.15034 Transcript_5397/m.15034 type:complete len:219 (+) Transcript_5397:85-741(+)